MDKIKALLQKVGASNELASQICEELEQYDAKVHEKYKKVYQTKLNQAKQICIEEVQKYKVELAQKVKIFLEGKSNQIEKRLDQLRAIEEGEAKALLRKVKEITEGIEVADDAKLRALKEKIEKLEAKNSQLMEEKKKALVAADRANKIALDIIEKSKVFIKEETEESKDEKGQEQSKSDGGDGEEMEEKVGCEVTNKDDSNKGNKAAKIKAILKGKIKQRKPQTTRKTLAESQVTTTASVITETDNDILKIANSI